MVDAPERLGYDKFVGFSDVVEHLFDLDDFNRTQSNSGSTHVLLHSPERFLDINGRVQGKNVGSSLEPRIDSLGLNVLLPLIYSILNDVPCVFSEANEELMQNLDFSEVILSFRKQEGNMLSFVIVDCLHELSEFPTSLIHLCRIDFVVPFLDSLFT